MVITRELSAMKIGLGMAEIEFEDGAIEVDATIVAEGLRIEPLLVQEQMREATTYQLLRTRDR